MLFATDSPVIGNIFITFSNAFLVKCKKFFKKKKKFN